MMRQPHGFSNLAVRVDSIGNIFITYRGEETALMYSKLVFVQVVPYENYKSVANKDTEFISVQNIFSAKGGNLVSSIRGITIELERATKIEKKFKVSGGVFFNPEKFETLLLDKEGKLIWVYSPDTTLYDGLNRAFTKQNQRITYKILKGKPETVESNSYLPIDQIRKLIESDAEIAYWFFKIPYEHFAVFKHLVTPARITMPVYSLAGCLFDPITEPNLVLVETVGMELVGEKTYKAEAVESPVNGENALTHDKLLCPEASYTVEFVQSIEINKLKFPKEMVKSIERLVELYDSGEIEAVRNRAKLILTDEQFMTLPLNYPEYHEQALNKFGRISIGTLIFPNHVYLSVAIKDFLKKVRHSRLFKIASKLHQINTQERLINVNKITLIPINYESKSISHNVEWQSKQ